MTRILTWTPGMESLDRAAVTVGVFDGVHAGHQQLIRDTTSLAHDLGVSAAVVTFDRDPDTVVSPRTAALQLTSLADKIALLEALEADVVLVIPFTAEVAALSPEAFLDDILLAAVPLAAVEVGCDFRFGSRARGDVNALRAFGQAHGFPVIAHELLHIDGAPVTSTRIRALIARGDMRATSVLLGRPYDVQGTVVRGRGEGAAMGVPTANISVDRAFAMPAHGVYAGFATVDGARYAAGISLGVPPTFPQATDTVEAHLLGYEGDLRQTRIRVAFVERLRSQRRFADRDALVAAIREDLTACERLAEPFLR